MVTHNKRNTLIFDPVTRQRLEAIQAQYGLSLSDSARRGIEMLHDYLVLDIMPGGEKSDDMIKDLIDAGVKAELQRLKEKEPKSEKAAS